MMMILPTMIFSIRTTSRSLCWICWPIRSVAMINLLR